MGVVKGERPINDISLGLYPARRTEREHLAFLVFFPFPFFFFFFFLELHSQYTDVPWLGVQSELQLPAYATAIATPEPSHVCNLHHSSQQHQILNPLMEGRDQTHTLMIPSWICFCCAKTGTLCFVFFVEPHLRHVDIPNLGVSLQL